MKKGRNIWIVLLVVIVGLLALSAYRGYNGMVTRSEQVTAQWGNVETQYQRRADLIPNLVSTVKGYAEFERETLEAVINARAKASSVQVNAENLTPEALQQFQEAQNGVSGALGRLLVVIERYPDLKANQNFMDLQSQLEGTENRISTERRKFNEVAQFYNTFIRLFPRNIWAGLFGFDKKPYFEAAEGSDKAPQVQF